MFTNIAGLLVIIALAVLFGWLVWRAWRAKNVAVKWIGTILSGLLTLVLVAISVLALVGLVKMNTRRGNPVREIQIEGTAEQVSRGEHLANAFCVDCHSLNGEFPMTGGRDLAKDLPMPLGNFVSVNLTPAGPLKDWSDGEILRVLREGVDRNGRPLVIMANTNVRYMSNEDLESVIAFMRSQPAVENQTPEPPDKPNLLAAILLGAGLLPEGQAPVTGTITAPPKEVNAEYGKYVVSYQDCTSCHGPDLNGGRQGQMAPIGPSLRVVKGWTQEQFLNTFRTGVDPNGLVLKDPMPWKAIGRLDEVELGALYMYLKSLP